MIPTIQTLDAVNLRVETKLRLIEAKYLLTLMTSKTAKSVVEHRIAELHLQLARYETNGTGGFKMHTQFKP